ncbi:MAG: Gfo/Idh/MocA family oxidoreductase [Akkermansiaceae bacterium]|nr:Gfo/Idh/MocA family oxidoreductase [Akkermansiaceae bacterium]
MTGIGIIGTGVIFREHARALDSLNQCARLVAVAEIDEAKRTAATEEFFIPFATGDHHELLARKDVDIVAICTPPGSHEQLVRDALEAGKRVVCEKPLANTLAITDRLLEMEEEYPGKVSVVYQLRYQAEIRAMLDARDQGLLGDMLTGKVYRFGQLNGSEAGRTGWWGRWASAGGGVAMTQFIHHFDQMCCLFGKPVEVRANMDTLKQDIESEDTFAAVVRFENGSLVNCGATVAAQHSEFQMDIIGREASMHLPWRLRSSDPATLRRLNRAVAGVVPPTPGKYRRFIERVIRVTRRKLGWQGKKPLANDHARYWQAILEATAKDTVLPVSIADARQSLDLCIGVYQAAMQGGVVKLPLTSTSPFYEGITSDHYSARGRDGN